MKKLLLPLAFLVFVLSVVVHYNMTKELSSQEKASSITTTKRVQITNPDYLADPSAYLVDYKNKVSSSHIPFRSYSYRRSSGTIEYLTVPKYDKRLWVEDVINSQTLLVSYPIEISGTKVLALKYLQIPGLNYPSVATPMYLWEHEDGICWRSGMTAFLKTNLLHKPVYLMKASKEPSLDSDTMGAKLRYSGYILFMLANGQSDEEYYDVASFMIVNGYGGIRHNYEKPSYRHGGISDLKGEEEVASLAERGLWSTCSDE